MARKQGRTRNYLMRPVSQFKLNSSVAVLMVAIFVGVIVINYLKYSYITRVMSSFYSLNEETREILLGIRMRLLITDVILIIAVSLVIILVWVKMTHRIYGATEKFARLMIEGKLEIEHMLNNLDQGIFTINPDCSINAQHSLRARTLFGMDNFQGAKLEEIFDADEDGIRVFKKWVELVGEPRFFKKWKMYEKLNPFRVINKKSNGSVQILKVDYRPIVTDNSLAKIMVLTTDITEKVKSEKALKKSRREQEALMERVIALVNTDKPAVDKFVGDIEGYLRGFDQIKSSKRLSTNVTQLYRDMHTIKGNAGTFGFGNLARLAGNLEELFIKLKTENISDLYEQWCRGLELFTTEFGNITDLRRKIFSGDKKDRIGISGAAYNKLIQGIRSGEILDIDQIFEHLCNLDSEPFGSYCKKYQRIIQLYREKYNKNIEDLKIENPEQIVHRDIMHALDPSMVHIIRNAVDHGIERNEEREKANKGAGIISISFESDKNGSTLTISDNGKGMDPDLIAKVAVERNLIPKKDLAKLSTEEKINLIFESGLTTTKEAGEISGRGVGLDAVKTYMEKLNGSVSIETKVGNGTIFVLKLPPILRENKLEIRNKYRQQKISIRESS